ncbi:MAG: hypothetical protein PHZ00_02735 [Candidatus Peribacteraceae bacterium]|nr:hypothetical protein [Candidatus Peribacteraceae bacterium]
MSAFLKRRQLILWTVLIALLLGKYYWSFFLFPGIPFGYDAGIYRFLYLRHAEGWPPGLIADLPEWARAHALGLFAFTSPLITIGLPVDWLIGWMWNLFPVMLASVLGWATGKKHGTAVGLAAGLVALLSTVQFEGFLMMYQKVFVAFLWCVFAFHFFERRSLWWIMFGMLVIATHQQIGLIVVLAILAAIIGRSAESSETGKLRAIIEWVTVCSLGFLWYLPTYQRSFLDLLPFMLRPAPWIGFLGFLGFLGFFSWHPARKNMELRRLGIVVPAVCILIAICIGVAASMIPSIATAADSEGGAFLSIIGYLRWSLPLFVLGLGGLLLSFRKRQDDPWQWAALVSLCAVFSMFFFYRRFILPLDFFLLPFAAVAVVQMIGRGTAWKIAVVILLLAQAGSLGWQMNTIDPHVTAADLTSIRRLPSLVPAGSTVVVLDNMAPWVVGYLPHATVSGPGIFDSKPRADWEKLLFGSENERRSFIASYPKGTYFFASDVFRSFYPSEGQSLLGHPCFSAVGQTGLYQSTCGQ